MNPLRWDVLGATALFAIPVLLLGAQGTLDADELVTRLLWCLLAGWVSSSVLRAAFTPRAEREVGVSAEREVGVSAEREVGGSAERDVGRGAEPDDGEREVGGSDAGGRAGRDPAQTRQPTSRPRESGEN